MCVRVCFHSMFTILVCARACVCAVCNAVWVVESWDVKSTLHRQLQRTLFCVDEDVDEDDGDEDTNNSLGDHHHQRQSPWLYDQVQQTQFPNEVASPVAAKLDHTAAPWETNSVGDADAFAFRVASPANDDHRGHGDIWGAAAPKQNTDTPVNLGGRGAFGHTVSQLYLLCSACHVTNLTIDPINDPF